MKDTYNSKPEFIKDFIVFCRNLKRKHREQNLAQTGYLKGFIKVCDELWAFGFYVDSRTIATDAVMVYNGQLVKFPKTTWGGPYSRWDTELREFLVREVCKNESLIS